MFWQVDMINPEKIRIMAKLAIYEKNYGEKDRKANMYFKHDYIYWSNFWTRLFVFIGCLILIGLYVLDMVFVKGEDIFSLNYYAEVYKVAVFIISMLLLYTVIGYFSASKKYRESQARIKKQLVLLKKLDRIEEKAKAKNSLSEGDSLFYHGPNIGDTRADNTLF
jgi:hypothetical protein